VQVAGVWRVSETYAAVTGGECLADAFAGLVGVTGTGTLQITQNGASLTARATDDATGASCDYVGTAGTSTIALNTSSCTASDFYGAACPTGGGMRDVRLLTGGFNATVTGTSATGTGAQTYNVFVAGTSTPVGTIVVSSRLTATRR
jgi:hypothetical protein